MACLSWSAGDVGGLGYPAKDGAQSLMARVVKQCTQRICLFCDRDDVQVVACVLLTTRGMRRSKDGTSSEMWLVTYATRGPRGPKHRTGHELPSQDIHECSLRFPIVSFLADSSVLDAVATALRVFQHVCADHVRPHTTKW